MFFRKRIVRQLVTHYLAHKRDDLWRGAVAGAIGGLAGSGVMQLGQWALSSRKQNGGTQPSPQQIREQGSEGQNTEEEPTVKVATAVTQTVMKTEPSPKAKNVGGALVHYAFGTGLGAVYGAVSELLPAVTYAEGAPFGAAVWAAADLGAVPAFGLSKPPHRVPVSRHAQMLAMHVAYGLTTDTVRRAMRRVI